MHRIRVALFDDHPLMLDGLAHTLASQRDFVVVGRGTRAADAVRCAQAEKPDVILLDIQMPGGGLNVVPCITKVCPAAKIVMFTVSKDPQHIRTALSSGIHGYMLKGIGGPELIETVRAIHKGITYLSPGIAAHLTSNLEGDKQNCKFEMDYLDELTAREDQVLELVAQGLRNKEIGLALSLSEKTVKHYITQILQKLHVRSRVEAALLARRRMVASSRFEPKSSHRYTSE